MYMARTGGSRTRSRGVSGLPWRITKIRVWRERAGLTQQEVADHLAEMGAGLNRDRVSIARIETGKQRPAVNVLEAMVAILGAPNLTAMLDRTPEEIGRIVSLSPKERRRFLRLLEADREE